MINEIGVTIQVHRPEPDEIETERVPLSTQYRERYDLVVVGRGKDGFNFLMKRLKTGMPPLIKLGDMILRHVEADKTHPDCVVHEYAVVPLTVVEVPEDTIITYPAREGPARTLIDWQKYADQQASGVPPRRPKESFGARLEQLVRGYY
jgi:hypothetical protein